jgi:hypothetical protein
MNARGLSFEKPQGLTEAAELTAKSKLIQAIDETTGGANSRNYKPRAVVARTNPPSPRFFVAVWKSVTIDRLTVWLTAPGRTVEIRIRPYDAKAKTGAPRDRTLVPSVMIEEP